jgi:nitrate reductase NapAB chaperone NapD
MTVRLHEREITIASSVMRVVPAHAQSIKAQVNAMAAHEIAADDGAGRLVLITEAFSTGLLLDAIDAVRALPHVLSVDLVYQHGEGERAMNEILTTFQCVPSQISHANTGESACHQTPSSRP